MPHHDIRDPDQLHALLDAILSIESDLDISGVLQRIVEAACGLTKARYGALGVLSPSGKALSEFITVGIDEDATKKIGHLPEGEGILGLLILDPEPLRLADLTTHPDSVGFPPNHPPMKSFLGVPVLVRDEVFGNLYLTEKQGAAEFSEADEALVVALSRAAGIAIDNARLHSRVNELRLAADRERIARDLHDTVIQRLFATGLSLQSALPLVPDPDLRSRIQDSVADLDETIRQVRTTIFALEPPRTSEKGVRARVLEICAQASRSLGFDPEVRFSGPLDRTVTEETATEMLSTLREALSNIARHAKANRAEIELSMGDRLKLLITDNGDGMKGVGAGLGHGLTNMADRAQKLGGSLTISSEHGQGTQLIWEIPTRI